MYKNVLWIDPAVREYQVFVDSVNADTLAMVYPEPLDFDVERIGFVFEKNSPMATYLQENIDLWIGSGVKHMDFLACETLPEWEEYYTRLRGIRVGASNNQTGNLQYGGDWVMESTCEDVERIYFNQTIDYYKYLLGSSGHSCILIDGAVWGCGYNDYGQLGSDRPNGTISDSNFEQMTFQPTALTSYGSITYVIDENKNVWSTGDPNNGGFGTTRLGKGWRKTNMTGATAIASGTSHCLALKEGTVWSCGKGSDNRLGRVYSTNDGFQPTDMSGVTTIACGNNQSLAIKDGVVWSCGESHSQLGRPYSSNVGFQPTNMSGATAISGGYRFSVALKEGRLFLTGELNRFNYTVFTEIITSGVTSIACNYQNCLVLKDGILWSCGNLPLGRTYIANDGFEPTNMSGVTAFACGQTHGLVIKDTTLWSCGQDLVQLGRTQPPYDTFQPTDLSGVIAIACGDLYTFALKDQWYGCGMNPKSQLGFNSGSISRFEQITIGRVISVATGSNHTLLLDNNNQVWATGFNQDGRLGFNPAGYNNTYGFRKTNMSRVTKIAAGDAHSLAIKDGIVWSCGSNLTGQLGRNTTNSTLNYFETTNASATLISAGKEHSLLLNQTVWSCGVNTDGRLGMIRTSGSSANASFKDTLLSATSIACGNTHSLILKEGTVWSCGSNLNGQLGRNTADTPNYFVNTNMSATAISAGNEYSMIVNQTVWSCGLNPDGRLGMVRSSGSRTDASFQDTLFRASSIETGNTHSIAIKNGTVWSCGSNLNGQLGRNTSAENNFSFESTYLTAELNEQIDTSIKVPLEIHATCFFGYFKPLLTGPHQFTLAADDLVNFRLGNQTLYELRTQTPPLLNVNASTPVTSTSITLQNTSYYPIVLTYVNTNDTRSSLTCTVTFDGTSDKLFNYCSLDKQTPGVYSYNLSKALLLETMSDLPSLENASVLERIHRIYSPDWAYGNLNAQAFWVKNAALSLVEGSVSTQILAISSISIGNGSILLYGTGFHSNVSVYVDGVEKGRTLSEGVFHVSASGYSSILLVDGLITSNLYTGYKVTSINKTAAIRNSSVDLSGYNFTTSNISYIKIGTEKATFSILSNNTVQVRVPDSTQTNQPFRIYSPQDEFLEVTTFTIPSLFYVSDYFPKTIFQGTLLQIQGSNFSKLSYAKIGLTNVSLTFNESTVFLTIPNTVGQSFTIYDEYNNSVSISGFNILEKLSTTTFSPTSAPQKSMITLSGRNFSNISAVMFGSVPSIVLWNSSLNLSVKVPDSDVLNCSIGVYDIYGNNSSYAINFTYANPKATTFAPLSAPSQSTLVLSGSFANISVVMFGNLSATWSMYLSNLSVVVPKSDGNASIVVYDLYGNHTSYATSFTYTNIKATTFAPLSAPSQTTLVLYGSFANISAVMFDNLSATWSMYLSNLSVVVPKSDGNASIVVYDLYGNHTSYTDTFTYTNIKATTFTPTTAIKRSTITLSGNFSNISEVMFGNVSATWSMYQYNLSVTVPNSDGNASIVVYDLYGNNTRYATTFTYAPVFQVTTFLPTEAVQRSPIVLSGTHFSNLDRIEFGNVSTRSFSYSSGEIRLNVPDSTQTQCILKVYDQYENSDAYSQTFTYIYSTLYPIDTYLPERAPLTIYGTSLENTSYVSVGFQHVYPEIILDPFGDSGIHSLYFNLPIGDGNVSITAYDNYDNPTNAVDFTYLNMSMYSVTPYGTTRSPITVLGKNLINLTNLYMGGVLVNQDDVIVDGSDPDNSIVTFYALPGTGNVSIALEDSYENRVQLDTFEYKNPRVTGFNTSKGRTRLSLMIYGENLNNTSYVSFGGVPNLFVIEFSDTYIRAVVPSTYGNVSVTVVDLYDNHTLAPDPFFCLGGNASIFRVTPNQGTKNTSVTIFGENLEFSTQATFGNSSDAPLNTTQPSFLNVSAPKGEGSVTIKVTDILDGSVYAYGSFVYKNLSITTMTPEGPIGSTVILGGNHLDTTKEVYFGNASVAYHGLNEVSFVVPDGSMNTLVYVIDQLGNVIESPISFVYRNPILTSITPSKAPPNYPMRLEGSNLANSSFLRFNTSVPILSANSSTVLATIPDGSGTVLVYLYDRYENSTTLSFTYQFPSITLLTPSSGPQRQSIRLSGEYLSNTSYVLFGSTPIYNFSYVDGLELIVPDGSGNVSVTAYDLYQNPARYDSYQYKNPEAKSITPSANVSGSTVILEGDLENTSSIWFGSTPIYNFSYANGSILLTVPPGSGNVSVTAYDIYQTPVVFYFQYIQPVLRSMSSTGPQRQPILLEGDSLDYITSIRFGGELVAPEYANGSIRVKVPDGSGNVSVVLSDNYGNTIERTYLYRNPFARSVTPSTNASGGTVILEGDLENTSTVFFGPYPTQFTYGNGSLSIKVPPGSGNVSITAYDPYLNSATIDSFDYFVTTIQPFPSSGPIGQPIRLTGDHLENVSSILFGESPANLVYANGSIQLKAPPQFSSNASEKVPIIAYDLYGNPAYSEYEYFFTQIQSIDVSESVIGSTVILNGYNLQNTSVLWFGGNQATDFTPLETSIQATVPPGTGRVAITAYDIYNNPVTIFPFDYIQPSIDSVYLGPPRQTLRITGQHLEKINVVKFGDNPATEIRYENGALLLTVPDGTGNVSIVAYDPYQNEAKSNYTYLNPFSRYLDRVAGVIGSPVRITGDYLENTSSIFFGSEPVTTFRFLEGALSITVPPGTGNVSITAYDAYLNAAPIYSFEYVFPRIQSITPPKGPQKQYVVLTGDYLENTSYVMFGDIPSPEIYFANASLRVKVPDDADIVSETVTVIAYDIYDNPAYTSYEYLNPELRTLEYQAATQRWPLTLRGDHLENTSKVRIGYEWITPSFISNQEVTVILPYGENNVLVSVIDLYGNQTGSQLFEYKNPKITRLSNLSGRTNLYMTLTGEHLQYTQDVVFGNRSQLGTLSNNVFETTLNVVVPEVQGYVPVKAIDLYGNETTYLSFFSLGGNASISRIDPNDGPNGANVSILGENLGFTKDVIFGGRSADILYPYTSSCVRVTIPKQAEATEVNVLVYDILDDGVMFYGKFYYKNPSLYSCSFSEGTTGTPIVLKGSHLSGTVSVYTNGSNISFVPSDTDIQIRAPPGKDETLIYVKDAYGNLASIPFTYQNPSVTVFPRAGATGSTLNFSGQYLSNTSRVYFNASAYLATVDQEISVQVPPGNASALLLIEDIYGNKIDAGVFTYQNPTLFALIPAEGIRNTYVNLSGKYLNDLSYVQFNGSRVSVTDLRVQVPTGTNTVSVYAVDIYDNSTDAFPFTYVTPEISSIQPAEGPRGSTLNLSGKYLRNISYVQVGDNRLTKFLNQFEYTPTGVQVIVPEGSGNVSVYIVDFYENVYESPVQFSYNIPLLREVFPPRGPARQTLTLTGDYLQNTSFVSFVRASSVPATITQINASSLQVIVPESSGMVNVSVTDRYGNETSIGYEYQNPTLFRVIPLEGGLLDTITITGIFLQNTSFVRFGKKILVAQVGDSIEVTLNNGRGQVEVSVEDRYGNVAVFPNLFTYNSTAIPEVDIYPYYGKPGDTIRVNLPDPLYAVAPCEYVFFGERQVPVFRDGYVEVRVPQGTTENLIQLLDASGELLAVNNRFVFERLRLSRMDPMEGFPGSTVLLDGDFTETTQVYFGILPNTGPFVPVQYIHRHALLLTLPDISSNTRITVVDANQQIGSSVESFLVKQPRVFSVTFEGTLAITGLYLSDILSVFFGAERVELTITDTLLSGPIPLGLGTVSVTAIPRKGAPLRLGNYTYPDRVEIPSPFRVGAVRCLAIDQKRLYFSNGRSIETLSEVIYIHDQVITGLAVETIVYFCDGRAKIYRYHTLTRRILPPYIPPEIPTVLKIHRNVLYALGTSLWALDLSTHQSRTYTIEPSTGMAFDGDLLYRTTANGTVVISTLTGESKQTILYGLNQPREIAVKDGHLFINGSILHYTLEQNVPTLVSRYETTQLYGTFAWSGQTLYLSNPSQIETLIIPSVSFRLDTMTSTGTENSPFELTGEGLDRISTILLDHQPVKEFQLCTSRRIVGKCPKGIQTPTIEILDKTYHRLAHPFTFTYENTWVYRCYPTEALEHTPVTVYGENLDRVLRVYMGGTPVDFTSTQTTLRIPHPVSGTFLLIDTYFNLIRNDLAFSSLRLEASICFCSGTIVHTDQGPVEIQKLMPGHTVYGKEIKGVTETYYIYDELVRVEAHAFRPDYPYRDTVMSKHHKIWLHGKMIEAQALIGHGVSWIPYRQEKLYNVLLEEEGRMNVQGMICETLDPSNPIASRFRWTTKI